MVFHLYLIAALLQTLPAQKPSFEVASVRPNRSVGASMLIGCVDGTGPQYGVAPGTCRASNASLQTIIAVAYDIPFTLAGQHISAAPNWIRSERYDVEAKAEDATASKFELRLMLQNLLAERFKLSLHEETREVSGYALVVAKGGPKSRVFAGKTAVACGASSTEELARCLSSRLGQPVVDKANITERNLSLTLASLGENQPDTPSIFTVLEEQLGLKLESRKVPLKILVIDHVERPTAN